MAAALLPVNRRNGRIRFGAAQPLRCNSYNERVGELAKIKAIAAAATSNKPPSASSWRNSSLAERAHWSDWLLIEVTAPAPAMWPMSFQLHAARTQSAVHLIRRAYQL
jgi:hypothetical protein